MDIKIEASIGGGCNEEFVRLVKALPKCSPGKQNNQPVKVRYDLPVQFKYN